MGKYYSYHIHIGQKQVVEALHYLHKRSHLPTSDFKLSDGVFTKVFKDWEGNVITEEHLPLHAVPLPLSFNTSLVFKEDDIIYDFYSLDATEAFPVDFYRVGEGHFWVGTIEVTFQPKTHGLEIAFTSVASAMSEVFWESPSIRQFFTAMAENLDATHGYFTAEDHLIRLFRWQHQRTDQQFWGQKEAIEEKGILYVLERLMANR